VSPRPAAAGCGRQGPICITTSRPPGSAGAQVLWPRASRRLPAHSVAAVCALPRCRQEQFLAGVAALVAPYVGVLRLQQELASVDSLMGQVLPVRVAHKLTQTAAAGQLGPGVAPPLPQGLHAAPGAAATSRAVAAAAAAAAAAASPGGAGVPGQRPEALGPLLTFASPAMEGAYARAAAAQQPAWWETAAMAQLLLLALLPHLWRLPSTANLTADATTALVVVVIAATRLQWLAQRIPGPAGAHATRSRALLAGLRCASAAVFVAQPPWQHWPVPPSGAAAAAAAGAPAFVLAACLAFLLAHGLCFRMPFKLHLWLQLAAAAAVVAACTALPGEAQAATVLLGEAQQAVWPLAALAAVTLLSLLFAWVWERQDRMSFMRRLQ